MVSFATARDAVLHDYYGVVVSVADPRLPPGLMAGQPAIPGRHHSLHWAQLLHAVQHQWRQSYELCFQQDVWQTSAAGLWEAWLDGLPSERSEHDCRACRAFVTTFGGIVTKRWDGSLFSPFWEPARVPGFYRPAVAAMQQIILKSEPVGQFEVPTGDMGTPSTPLGSHFGIARPHAVRRFRR